MYVHKHFMLLLTVAFIHYKIYQVSRKHFIALELFDFQGNVGEVIVNLNILSSNFT